MATVVPRGVPRAQHRAPHAAKRTVRTARMPSWAQEKCYLFAERGSGQGAIRFILYSCGV